MEFTQALIIGAGPTGMTAAIELRRAGLDVMVVDKAERMAAHSQALVVQARTLEQFQRYGIAETVVQHGRPLKGIHMRSEGEEIAHVVLDAIPSRYPFVLFIPQSETEAILNAEMERLGVRAVRGVELTSLTQTADAATAEVKYSDGRTEQIVARWVVGCDGSHSKVRASLGIPFAGASVDLSFILGDLKLEGEDKPDDELVVNLNGGDVVFMGPLTDGLTRVIVARHRKEDQTPGQAEVTLADFQRGFDEFAIRVRAVGSQWMTPFHVNDRQAKHYRSGRVFLVGDASHIHSPLGGQGMNTGIQDAANLCWKIAAVERGVADAEKLLDSYEEERSAVGRGVLSFTERGLKLATIDNPVLIKLRNALMPHLASMSVVQRSIAAFVSETGIEYRSSRVVADYSTDGDLRAGDRMPDLALGETTLLRDWTDGRHLALLVNGTDEARDEMSKMLTGARTVAIASAQLDADGKKALGEDTKLVIVRPDGYVGLRAPLDDRDDWMNYAKQDGLVAGQ